MLSMDNEKLKRCLLEANEKLEKYSAQERLAQKKMVNSSVQVSYVKETMNQNSMAGISSFFSNISPNLISGVAQNAKWVGSCVTAIMNEKLISDFLDDAEFRPRRSFQDFVLEWFFKR